MTYAGVVRPDASGSSPRAAGSAVALVIAVAAALDLAAGTGVAYLTGFPAVGGVLVRIDWAWLVVTGSLLVSFAGYFRACQGIFRVDGGRPPPGRQMPALVAVDFGGLLAHGGALDRYALQACGTGEDEAKVRAGALAGMEQGMLALAGCAAAITVLVGGLGRPGGGFTLPWAIIPVPGFALG
ncbi:MAG: hypothetical protein M3Z75_32355 [Actinomycetota bacterium]|nr:hypothetical protein [Actinomycetota bacterium]